MNNTLLWDEYKLSRNADTKKQIMTNYSRLIYYVIHNSRFANLDILDDRDYFQFGVEGLSEAIDRFDPDYGTKFETYAIQRIRGKIIDELRKIQKKKPSNGDERDYGYVNLSMDTPIDDENSYTLSEIIPGDSIIPDEETEKRESIELLTAAIKDLPERDRIILGLYYYEHQNYQDIAKILNITVSRVSQVHTKIIKTLRAKLEYMND